MFDRSASNREEWARERPYVDLPAACYCDHKRTARKCQPCVARLAVEEQGVGE